MKKKTKTIKQIIADAIKNGVIGKEDALATKTLLTWLRYGRKRAEGISKEYVNNLVRGGFVNKKGTHLDGDADEPLWIVLAIAGAHGYLKQTTETK